MNFSEQTLLELTKNLPTLIVCILLYKDIIYTKTLVTRQEELIGKVSTLLDIVINKNKTNRK
jgi:hypothetical protein